MNFDCVIIGGGPAGLTAATYLGRFRREVLVVDAGHSRAHLIPKTHNYPGFADGISGPDLLRILYDQAQQYGATMARGTASDLARNGDGFSVTVEGTQIDATRILLATGLKDRPPDMAGLRQAVDHASVRYCPICDAFEAIDQKIAVYGSILDAEPKALFLRTYSREITVLPLDANVDAGARRRLEKANIAIARSVPVDFRPVQGGITVALLSGDHLSFDVLYPALGCDVRSDLAADLGARRNSVGCMIVDDKQHTSASGIYAAGDVVSDLHQLSVAVGHACVAATAIHRSLPTNYR